MIEFSPITLADKELVESYTQVSKIQNCDLSFANMYCWQRTFRSAWAIVEGYLVIRFGIDGGEKLGYMQPIGADGNLNFASIIPLLAQDAHSRGERLRIIGLTEEGCEALRRSYGGDFALYADPNLADYIYSSERLSSLAGKKLQAKRNHINQFRKLYPEYEYRDLTPDQFESCLRLDCKWRAAHGDLCDDMTPEREAMLRAFANFEELALRGGVLYVGGEVVAFTYGSQINATTFCVHVEKGDADVTGCYTMINKLFAESLSDMFVYLNREEDLGIEGLRRAKMSYYPDYQQRKYTAIYLHHDEKECKRLWQEVFGDGDEFIDEYLMLHYSQHRMLRVTDPDNRYLSMVHIIPFESEIGRVAYIYGVATAPSARGMGYATKLMSHAMSMICKDGYAAAMLIPSEEWLKDYYKRFGFAGEYTVEFCAYNSFDFGSGTRAGDIAMVCPFGDTLEPTHLRLFKG